MKFAQLQDVFMIDVGKLTVHYKIFAGSSHPSSMHSTILNDSVIKLYLLLYLRKNVK